MSTAASVGAGIQAGIPLLLKIMEWAEQGLSTKEVQRRLADPSDVGEDLIGRITERGERGRDLLGRDPKPPG